SNDAATLFTWSSVGFALAAFPLSKDWVFGTARSGQGRAGCARRSEPLTARTVLEDGEEGKGGWPRVGNRRSLGFLLSGLAALLAERLAFQLDAIGVVNQAIQDAIGNGGIADLFVPVGHWHLRGQDQGAALVAVITDFQEIAALGILQRRHGEVVQQQN